MTSRLHRDTASEIAAVPPINDGSEGELVVNSSEQTVTGLTTDLDAAIAAFWPGRWAKANNPTLRNRSKARNNLRKAYRAAMKHLAFVKANPCANCGNCDNLLTDPSPELTGTFCAFDSDFHGYQRVDASAVCTRHSLSITREPQGEG